MKLAKVWKPRWGGSESELNAMLFKENRDTAGGSEIQITS